MGRNGFSAFGSWNGVRENLYCKKSTKVDLPAPMLPATAVAGNIGAGKSTLVDFLQYRFSLTPFHEPNAENPFLPMFYGDMKRWAFHSQMFFLAHKFQIHQDLSDHPRVVTQILMNLKLMC